MGIGPSAGIDSDEGSGISRGMEPSEGIPAIGSAPRGGTGDPIGIGGIGISRGIEPSEGIPAIGSAPSGGTGAPIGGIGSAATGATGAATGTAAAT